ncbi:MAG: hypothetical protein K0U93_24045 [Gammaproteobacteria bacterium]|nr:hypothetical protein [Gammaproteobacteria bacterium]
MAENYGFCTLMGAGLESTWGTAVAATHKVPYVNDGLDGKDEHLQMRALVGASAMRKSRPGQRIAGGPIEAYLTYGIRDPFLEQFFGAYTDETGIPDHYDLAKTTLGKGLTIPVNRGVAVHEYIGYRIGKLTVKGSPGDGVMVSVEGNGKDRIRGGSITNNAAALDALAEPGDEVLFHEVFLRVGDLTVPLAVANEFCPTEFTLELDRQHVVKQVNKRTAEQARENDFFLATLSFTLPYYDTEQWMDWHEDDEVLQASLIFTDGTSTKNFNLPQMLVTEAPVPQSGAEMTEPTVTMSAHPNGNSANAHPDFDFPEVVRLFEE